MSGKSALKLFKRAAAGRIFIVFSTFLFIGIFGLWLARPAPYQVVQPILAAPGDTPTPTVPLPTATPTTSPASGPTGTPVGWVENYQITELGRSAERARELLSWVFSHPPLYQASVLDQIWTISRNIAFGLALLTVIMFAAGFVLAQRRGVTLTSNVVSILFKIAGVLLFIYFSHAILLAILGSSEFLMRVFIEKIGGKDLFNIFFVGGTGASPNTETNYTEFFGYLNVGPRQVNLEMINTSMLLIRLTNLTYYVMSVMLILRHVILWFLLILSPFLALLLPFIFIRNTGWIWIGVFLQWVFYGPLFALFLVALTKIWVAGIPYSFDFNRTPDHAPAGVKACDVTPFKTSINILYGGPAQNLSLCNSANYIDTYAEYIIALIMLWVATFLPWLLLRIFRDYCCDIIAQNQAVLVQILDRLRSFGMPPPVPPTIGPTATAGQVQELPFRRMTTAPVSTSTTKITEIERNIENVRTQDIVSAMNLSVSSIQDIARLDLSRRQQEEKRTSLESIRNPTTVADRELRESFSKIRSELYTRASQGDSVAQRVVSATERRLSDLSRIPAAGVTRAMTTPEVATKTGVSEEQVRTILTAVPTVGMPSVQHLRDASAKAGVSVAKVSEVLASARPTAMVSAATATIIAGRVMTTDEMARKTNVPEDKVRAILARLPTAGVPTKEQIKATAAEQGVPEATVEQVIALARPEVITAEGGKPKVGQPAAAPPAPVSVDDYEDVKEMWINHYRNSDVPVSDRIKTREQWLGEDTKKLTNIINLITNVNPALRNQGMSEVASILPFLLLGGFSDAETVIYLKAKKAAAEQVSKELGQVARAKEEGKKEGEEELVEVPGQKAEKKPEELHLTEALEEELPKGEEIKPAEGDNALKSPAESNTLPEESQDQSPGGGVSGADKTKKSSDLEEILFPETSPTPKPTGETSDEMKVETDQTDKKPDVPK